MQRIISAISAHWIFFSLVILSFGVAWIWISAAPHGNTTAGSIPAPRKGFQSPNFSLENDKGETITLSDLRGYSILINVWASWCPPCRAEMPAMQQVYEEYFDQNFLILAINATNQDSWDEATAFIQAQEFTFPVLFDTEGKFSRVYQISALPTSFFVSKDGTIREVIIGGPMSETLLRVRVEELLQEGP